MKLADSKLCVECDELTGIADTACPCCTCTHFIMLARIILPLRPEDIRLVRTVGQLYDEEGTHGKQ